jgi:hypothetical protein
MRPSAQLIAAILFSLLLLPPDGAKASTVLDQSYLVTNNSGLGTTALLFPSFRRAQTFTVGLAGTLVEVDVAVDPMSLFAGKSAILNLLSTVAGVPTSVLQTSPTVNSALVNGFMDFAVSLPVIVGEVLAFELVESNSGYLIFSSIPGTYPGGADFIINTDVGINSFTAFTGGDADFRTFVDTGTSAATPLPAALPLFATGLGALGLFGWRRKRKAQAAA